MRSGTILFALLLLSLTVQAQSNINGSEDDDDPYSSEPYFMSAINYLSNNVYLGRKDTTTIPYYSPYIGYHFKSGIYAKGMVSYTTAKGGLIDLTTLEAGYDHNFTEHFNGGICIDKFFYNKNSLSVRANTKGSGGIYGQFNNNIIQPQFTFDLNFNGKSKDYVIGIILDHEFVLADNAVKIIPTIGFMSGTQNYYDEYFINRLNKKDKKGNVKSVVSDPDKLVPLVYEFSTKVTYMTGKWLFSLTPNYAIPVSPATVTINNKVSKEKLSNSFYLELDICHR